MVGVVEGGEDFPLLVPADGRVLEHFAEGAGLLEHLTQVSQVLEAGLQRVLFGGGAEERSCVFAGGRVGEGGRLVACVGAEVPATDCTASEKAKELTLSKRKIINLLIQSS